ncbi:hypothetical protein K488DRAFT_84394 [Vararia minispora EC-137]|uniref:Uncharacterized protein n=1 Tax=Vararia minispora EC-137 TaxID=1314806 RepID=A0ACB8QRA1_9AGAM|nr:hypothetical protein K488DRAFT_84394 [Vararia minispora EC-137]
MPEVTSDGKISVLRVYISSSSSPNDFYITLYLPPASISSSLQVQGTGLRPTDAPFPTPASTFPEADAPPAYTRRTISENPTLAAKARLEPGPTLGSLAADIHELAAQQVALARAFESHMLTSRLRWQADDRIAALVFSLQDRVAAAENVMQSFGNVLQRISRALSAFSGSMRSLGTTVDLMQEAVGILTRRSGADDTGVSAERTIAIVTQAPAGSQTSLAARALVVIRVFYAPFARILSRVYVKLSFRACGSPPLFLTHRE